MDKNERNKQEITVWLDYFKSLRDEIHLRIREHTQLVWIKIISLGVIISFCYGVIKGSESLSIPLSYFIWIIPLAAVIFDMLIAGNLRVINNLGHYIKKYIENGAFKEFKENIAVEQTKKIRNTPLDWLVHPISLLIDWWTRRHDKEEPKLDAKFWEEVVAQSELKYRCYMVENILAIWLFTLASGLFSSLFRWQFGFDWIDIILSGICVMGIIYALIYLIRSITMKRMF